MDASQLPEPLREGLLRYLGTTSQDQARLIGELTQRNPGQTRVKLKSSAAFELTEKGDLFIYGSGEDG